MKFDNIALKEISCILCYKPDKKYWRAENRKSHIMGIQLRGSAVHRFTDKEFTIGESCIYFLNQSEDYEVEVLEPTYAFSVHFTTYEPIELESFCQRVIDPTGIENLIESIGIQLLLTSSTKNTKSRLFYELCDKFNAITNSEYMPHNLRLVRAKEYIDLHFPDDDVLDSAAAICSVSRRRFNDIFKKYVNSTPNDYLIDRRCTFAKQLLSTGAMSIADIAYTCGFENPYYFSRTFKKKTGLTPSEYKKIMG